MSLIDLASLVLAPTAVKDGKVYNAIPNDQDFTFSRGTEATRVNSAGLIEKARTNRLLQSNNFNTTWGTGFSTLTSGQVGYNGTNDAWKVESTTIGGETRIRQSQTFTTGEVITLSVYMKKGNVNFGIVRTYAITGGGRAWFDLENGTVETENSGINGSIEDVGNGWYRCSIWGVIDTTGAVDIAPAPADGDYLADAVGEFIYIQDSQLESGLVATEYIETTTSSVTVGITDDLPRVDYSKGGCPSLLLEPSRTNFYLHSEYISNFSGTETFNSAISPEGVANAVLLTKTSDSDQYVNISWSGATLSTSTDYTLTAFVKHAGDDVNLRYEYNNSNDWGKAWNALFEVRSSGVTASTANGCTSDVEDYGNDWYRIIVNVTTGSSITPSSPSNLIRVIGDNTEEVLIYGVQFEAGSYSTSYIPSYGTSTSRSADSCNLTNASNLIGQSEGTLYWEVDFGVNDSSEYPAVFLYDGTSNNRILIQRRGNNSLLQYQVNAGGTNQVDEFSTTAVGSGKVKIAIAYKTNDFVLYLNGTQEANDTSGSTFSGALSQVSFENLRHDKTSQLVLFPTRLTNDQLAELTK